jgi:carbonic anhydrase
MRSKLKSDICAKLIHAIAPIAILATLAFAPAGWALDAPHGPSPAAALQQLLDGNRLYVADKTVRPDERPSDAKQEPKAVILSCSDARVAPAILFDQGVGSLFVVRTAGNTYDRLALESMEYAIGHLGTRLIMVLGHDQCGAVKAAVHEYPKPTNSAMLKNIYPAVAKTRGEPGDPVSNAVSENAELVAERLTHEPEFAAQVASGQLKIVAARYNLATGAVTILPTK